MMSIGSKIKVLRQKNLLTQDGLAKELGVSVATVNRWETNKVRPNMSGMKAIKSFCERTSFPYETIESGWLSGSVEEDK